MALIEGISRELLQDAAIDTLLGARTIANDRVFEPRDWPTRPDLFPILLVQAPQERKVNLYPGQLSFNTTITLVVVGRVIGDTPEGATEQLNQLARETEDALMLTPEFAGEIQQFVSIATRAVVTADGMNHIGEMGITWELEVFQVFGDPSFTPLREVRSRLVDQTTRKPLVEAAVVFPKP